MERFSDKIESVEIGATNTAFDLTKSINRGDEMANRSLPEYFSIDNLSFAPTPSGNRFRDLQGERFGRLVVLGYKGMKGNHREWFCLCDCGAVHVTLANTLRRGLCQSCGCLSKEAASARRTTHGRSGTKVHRTWKHIIARCTNPNSANYPDYGGRGITVCERWRNSFENFYADMGDPPTKEHSIERIDNEKGYEPDNCKWATTVEQQSNTRRTYLIEFNGRRQSLAAWCRELGLDYGRTHSRLQKGISPATAFRK